MISIEHFAPSMSARLEMTMNYYTLIEKMFKRRKELSVQKASHQNDGEMTMNYYKIIKMMFKRRKEV